MDHHLQARRVLELTDQLLDQPPEQVEATLSTEPDAVARDVRALLALDEADGEIDSFEVTQAIIESMVPAAPPAAPEAPDGFELHALIGQGAMGRVYRATQLVPRREVALKFVDGSGLREAQALSDASHAVIPAVYVVGESGGQVFVAMELVRGQPLRQWARGASPAERLALLEALCRGVDDIHRAGVLHRDLKPANVLVDATGPRLVDFGLAVDVEGEDAGLAGTLQYMADEVLGGAPATVRSDVFSLACLLTELMGDAPAMPPGRTPSQQRSARQTWRPPELPGPIGSVARRGLAPPAERYPTAGALADELARLQAGALPHAHTPTRRERAHAWARRNRRSLRLGMVAGLLLGLGAAWPALHEGWRARNAAAKLDRLLEQPGEALSHDGLTAFVALEEIQGTPAEARARLLRAAGARQRGDQPAEVSDLALVFAARGAHRPEAAARLAEIFAAERRWSALEVVVPALADPARRQAMARQVDVGLRRWSQGQVPPLLGALADAQPLGWQAQHLDHVDGWWLALLPESGIGAGTAIDALTLAPSPRWQGGPRRLVTVSGPRAVVDHGEDITLERPTGAGWQAEATLSFEGQVISAAAADFDGDGRESVFIGTAPAPRGLWVAQPPDWQPHHPDEGIERTDSDVLELLAEDLDGDGTPELLVLLGPWNAHDLRVYEVRADNSLRLRARERFGGTTSVAVITRPDGRKRVAVFKDDSYPNPRLFDAEAPNGLYLYALEGDHLRLAHSVEIPDLEIPWQGTHAGDFDGDGDLDLVSANQEGLVLVEMTPSGAPEAVHRTRGLRALGVVQADADPAHELLVHIDDETDVWMLGAGAQQLPPIPTAENTTDELELMGQFTAAAERQQIRAALADDPVQAAGHFAEAARLLERAHDFEQSLGELDKALEHTPASALYARKATLLQELADYPRMAELPARHRRGPTEVSTVTLRFDEALAPMRWEVPTALEHLPGEGLRILASAGDGVLASLPLRRTDEVVGVAFELDVISAEAGADLQIVLEDEDGDTLGLWVHPWGGSGQVGRRIGCMGDALHRHLSVFLPLRPRIARDSPISGRAMLDGTRMVCQLDADGAHTLIRRQGGLVLGEDLVLQIRARGSNPAAQIQALLHELVLTGLEPAAPVAPQGEAAISGRFAEALVETDDPIQRMELLGRLARTQDARDLFRAAAPQTAAMLPAIRRQPEFWLDLLRSETPDLLPEAIALGWEIAYASGEPARLQAILARGWVDQLPVSSTDLSLFMLRHARALLDTGQPERAAGVFSRIAKAGADTARPSANLGLAEAHTQMDHPVEARRACEAARDGYAGTFLYSDHRSASPLLQQACDP